MKLIVAAILLAGVVLGQRGGGRQGEGSSPHSNGENPPNAAERAEISREHYKKNVEETDKLLKLAMELKTDLDQQTGLTVSAKTAKDAGEVKKLADSIAKRIRSD